MPQLTRLLTCCLCMVLLTIKTSTAQTRISDFGAVTPEEIALKECSFDKTADAVILFDQALSNYDDEYHLNTKRRIRLKILKELGIERGNIHIRFYSKDNFEFITRINAVVITPGENGKLTSTMLDRKTIFTRKLNEVQ